MNIENLKNLFCSRGYKVSYFETAAEAKDFILEECGTMSVGMGGSVTLDEMGLFPALESRGETHWHFHDGSREKIKSASTTEVYISGVNAITETGEIINIDGFGNRVSASIYGVNRKKVLFVCGINKIEENLERGLWRAKNIAAPLNARRLARKTPCAIKADKCYNCNSPERICRVTAIFTHPTGGTDTHIILIGEKLGY